MHAGPRTGRQCVEAFRPKSKSSQNVWGSLGDPLWLRGGSGIKFAMATRPFHLLRVQRKAVHFKISRASCSLTKSFLESGPSQVLRVAPPRRAPRNGQRYRQVPNLRPEIWPPQTSVPNVRPVGAKCKTCTGIAGPATGRSCPPPKSHDHYRSQTVPVPRQYQYSKRIQSSPSSELGPASGP